MKQNNAEWGALLFPHSWVLSGIQCPHSQVLNKDGFRGLLCRTVTEAEDWVCVFWTRCSSTGVNKTVSALPSLQFQSCLEMLTDSTNVIAETRILKTSCKQHVLRVYPTTALSPVETLDTELFKCLSLTPVRLPWKPGCYHKEINKEIIL